MGKAAEAEEAAPRGGAWRRWLRRAALAAVLGPLAVIALYRVVPPPGAPYVWAEGIRLGGVERLWVPMDRIAPVMARAAVAAEDADFCRHGGFDISALRAAARGGARVGGSTITQQTVKNAFLWQGRSWPRKAVEAALTPAVELLWPKRRILEVYLNLAEFGEGVFGVEAAARDRFGVPASRLTAEQAARLAAVLPSPKMRDPADLPPRLLARAERIMDGAATIARDGRASCFGAG